VIITMLPTLTPPSALRPAAVLLPDRRRSPGATPQSSQIHLPQRRDQPIKWHQAATIVPSLPFNLLTASSSCLTRHPQR